MNSVNPLYLMIDKMIGHFEEKSGNKYLVLDDVNENKEVSKKYEEVWKGVKTNWIWEIFLKNLVWIWWWFANE